MILTKEEDGESNLMTGVSENQNTLTSNRMPSMMTENKPKSLNEVEKKYQKVL
jgi:hypothetical protein